MTLKVFVQVWSEIDPTLNVRIDRASGDVLADGGDLLRRVSPLGRAAVAAAAAISNAQVTAFAHGEQHTEALRHAVAAGAVQAIELLPPCDHDATGTTVALSTWLQTRKPNLVIADSPAGLLAGRLGWSHLAGLENLQAANGHLRAIRQLGRGEREIVTARLPAIVRLQSESIRPPYVSRARIRNVPTDAIRSETLEPVETNPLAETGPLKLTRIRTRSGQTSLKQEGRGLDRLAALISKPDGSANSDSGSTQLANSTPEQRADEFVRFLFHHGLLPPTRQHG